MIELHCRPTRNGHEVTMFLEETGRYAIGRYVNDINRLHGVLDRRLAEHRFVAGPDYTIADMAAYSWIVPWKRQQQDLDSFTHVRRWFDEIRARPATLRAYARAEAFTQPAVTEEGKKLLFGQTAASVAAR